MEKHIKSSKAEKSRTDPYFFLPKCTIFLLVFFFFLAIFTVKLILLSLIGEKTGAATFVLSEQILPKRNVRKR